MISQAQLHELKEALVLERDRIQSLAKHAKSFSRDRDKSRIGSDSIDESAAELVIGTHLRLADRESEYLSEVLRSLKAIDSNQYGQCEQCEDDIPWPRLSAFPTTNLCLECQQDEEIEIKRNREME